MKPALENDYVDRINQAIWSRTSYIQPHEYVVYERSAELCDLIKDLILERRFNWLAADDVGVKQNLLNHLRSLDKSLVVEASRLQAGLMVQHLREDHANQTQRLEHTVTVGKHNLKLVADKNAEGCKFEEFRTVSRGVVGKDDLTWLWWVLAAGVVALIIVLANG